MIKKFEEITYRKLDNKYPHYTLSVLRKILEEKGLPSTIFIIQYWERKKLIKSPRSKRNNWRCYTGAQIKKIVKIVSAKK